jgi:hypothetical protein
MRAALLIVLALSAGEARAEVPLDLAAVVTTQCGPEGYRLDGGCAIELGDGTYTVSQTVRLGRCEVGSTGTRNSVALVGQGAGLFATQPRFTTAGTTLRWTGPPGVPMLEVCGSWTTLQHLAIDGKGASHCIRLVGNNAGSAIHHFPQLSSLSLTGCGIGVEVTGLARNDQVDYARLERISITDVDVCYSQDSQQSVGGRLETVECVARKKGFEIRGGSLDCDGCYVGNVGADPAFIGFHFTTSVLVDGRSFSHHQGKIEASHLELRSGRFIVGDVPTNRYPLVLVGNSYSLQCQLPSCEMLVIEWRGKSPVVMSGDVVQASAPDSTKMPRARFCSPSGWRKTGVVIKGEVGGAVWACP